MVGEKVPDNRDQRKWLSSRLIKLRNRLRMYDIEAFSSSLE